MTAGDWCVVKVGGSLFDLPDLRQRIEGWLTRQPRRRYVFVAGAGPFGNALRELDARHHLQPETAHWMAVDCMRVTASLLHALWPDSKWICAWEDLLALQRAEHLHVVLDVRQFLESVEPKLPGGPLAHDWSVTSDSIAVRVAMALSADSCVLLKSRAPADGGTVASWAAEGYVDECLPQLRGELPPIEWVNLRDDVWSSSASGEKE